MKTESREPGNWGVERTGRAAVLNRPKFFFFVSTLGICLAASPCGAQQAPPQSSQAAHAHQQAQDPWWKHAVIYEIYPRSFQDSNGDGVGDINGITSQLAYLRALSIDAIWISPM